MKKFICFILFCSIHSHLLFSQADSLKRNNVFLEWGNSIWGNDLGIGYSYDFTKHFSASLCFSWGSFNYNLVGGQNLIFINNLEGVVHHINVDFKQLIDFKCSYNRKAGSGVLFLNKFELGMSYVNLTFNDEFAEDPYPGLWKGQKNISIYGLLLSINILEYKPRKEIHTAFMFGVKSRFTLLENPQTMVFENSTMGQSKNGTLWQGNGNNQFWFYPEVYLRVNYNF